LGAEVSGDVTVFRTLLTTTWEVEREWESLIILEIGVEVAVLRRNERREGGFCDGCEEGEGVTGEEKTAFVEEEAMAMGIALYFSICVSEL
jgi:hypothetical protein